MNEVQKSDAYPFMHGICPATSKIIDKLKNGEVGDIVTDEELKDICGKDTKPHGNGYGNLGTALRILERKHDKVWLRVKGANCLKCCNSTEIADVCDNDIQRVRRRTNRTNNRIVLVDISQLSSDDAKRFMANSALSGTIELMSRRNTIKKLIARGTKTSIDLPKLLAVFKPA